MIRRLLAPLLAALLLALVAPVAAHAAVLELTDARGDVHRMDDQGEFVLAEGEARGDVLRARVNHASRALVVRIDLARLRREGRGLGVAMRIRTNESVYRVVGIEASRRIGWGGRLTLTDRRHDAVRCNTRHEIDYAADVISFRVPRSCLSKPRWVQATLFNYAFVDQNFLLDNPHNDEARVGVWTSRIRRG